jgi:hypothetical protein
LSALVRYADAMAFPDENDAVRRLFGTYEVTPNARLFDGMGEMIRRLPRAHRYTFMGLAERHAAYPYLRPFLSEGGARALRRRMLHLAQSERRRKGNPPLRRTDVVHHPPRGLQPDTLWPQPRGQPLAHHLCAPR